MASFLNPDKMTRCDICDADVPAKHLHEHLLADARMLRIIKENNSGWNRSQCEEQLRSLVRSRQKTVEAEEEKPE